MNTFQNSEYEKIDCIKYKKYRKFKSSKISYIFHKKLVFSITCDKCGLKNEKVYKE